MAVLKGMHVSPETEFKKGHKGYKSRLGKKMPDWLKEKLRITHIGKIPWIKGKHIYTGGKRFEKGHIPWCKGKKRPEMTGNHHPLWKNGRTSLYDSIRHLLEYKQWTKKVFERDNFTCQDCGDNEGRNFNAHHKEKSFSQLLTEFLREYNQFSPIEDKETLLRLVITYEPFWDINNGITLCHDCHKKTKDYGGYRKNV